MGLRTDGYLWLSGGRCNVWVFCGADSSVNCPTSDPSTPPVPSGTCQLKSQQAVKSASDQPVAISNSTNFASGAYCCLNYFDGFQASCSNKARKTLYAVNGIQMGSEMA